MNLGKYPEYASCAAAALGYARKMVRSVYGDSIPTALMAADAYAEEMLIDGARTPWARAFKEAVAEGIGPEDFRKSFRFYCFGLLGGAWLGVMEESDFLPAKTYISRMVCRLFKVGSKYYKRLWRNSGSRAARLYDVEVAAPLPEYGERLFPADEWGEDTEEDRLGSDPAGKGTQI